MSDLAPSIFRQRLVIEGLISESIGAAAICAYLKALGPELGMHVLIEPVTHQSPQYGWSGWVHWETSGAHFYAWDKPTLFFSADIYTCKEFSVEKALDFTQRFFDPTQLAYGSFAANNMGTVHRPTAHPLSSRIRQEPKIN